MTKRAARGRDEVVGVDTHIVLMSTPGGPVPTPTFSPFSGPLVSQLSDTVFIEGERAALEGSQADNAPPHIPTGGPFQRPPSNQGVIEEGSASVFADGRRMARDGDAVRTCSDPADAANARVIATSNVFLE